MSSQSRSTSGDGVRLAAHRGARLQRPADRPGGRHGGAAPGRSAPAPSDSADRDRDSRGHRDRPAGTRLGDDRRSARGVLPGGPRVALLPGRAGDRFRCRGRAPPRRRGSGLRALARACPDGRAGLRGGRSRRYSAAGRDRPGRHLVRDRRGGAQGRGQDDHELRPARDRRSLARRLRDGGPALALLLRLGRLLRDHAGAAGPVPRPCRGRRGGPGRGAGIRAAARGDRPHAPHERADQREDRLLAARGARLHV